MGAWADPQNALITKKSMNLLLRSYKSRTGNRITLLPTISTYPSQEIPPRPHPGDKPGPTAHLDVTTLFWGWKRCHKLPHHVASQQEGRPCPELFTVWMEPLPVALNLRSLVSPIYFFSLLPTLAVLRLGRVGREIICGDTAVTASNPPLSCSKEEEGAKKAGAVQECLGGAEHHACRFPWKQDSIQGKHWVSATKPW